VPNIPSKSRGLADKNKKFLTEWKETTVLYSKLYILMFACAHTNPHAKLHEIHRCQILLFSSARSRDFDGLIGIELPVLMYTTKTPIDLRRFSVRSSTLMKNGIM
jgi:hypothetical protein